MHGRIMQMKVSLPFLDKGRKFVFDDDSGNVYGTEKDGMRMEYPLRTGLAGYLCLLSTEGGKYLKLIEEMYD